MSLEIGKKYFGILHLNEVHIDTEYNIPICLHTKYGNLYVIRKEKEGCANCVGNIPSICSNGIFCSCRLIKKYNKQNKKVLSKFVEDSREHMKIVESDYEWDDFYDEKFKEILNQAI